MERGYELIRKIAGGGMGEVFVARRTGVGNFEKRVALKFLLPHLSENPELVRRFHDEARLAARMHHPNIVEIFDVGEGDGRPFIAMQLVDGVTLSRLLKEVGKKGELMPLPLVRLIATGLCEALGYAHALVDGKGRPLHVVHRDVTPGNLLVSRNGAVLLTDFGIARVRDGSMTQPGVLRGKAAYVAPEQVTHDRRVDARADLYSAALTLYEACTGAHPFKREQFADALNAVIEGQVTRLEAMRRDVTPGFANAIHRALSREPDQRFSTAREMREALIDGPVATAPELAEYVRAYCPELSQSEDLQPVEEGTRSVITVTPTQLELPERPAPPPVREEPDGTTVTRVPRARLVGLGVVLGLLALLVGWGVVVSRPAPVVLPAQQTPPQLAPRSPEPVAVVEDPAVTPVAPEPTSAPEVPEPAPEPVARVTPKPRKPPKPPPAPAAALQVGYLTADASPWAEVSLAGKVLDRTPFAKYPVPVGRHVLVFRGPDGATQKRTVTVNENEVTAVRVEFPP
ncbi:MAG: protein kinase [Myxococcaceae bacterium]